MIAIKAAFCEKAITQSSTDVGDTHMYKHILIATDGSELAGKAVAHGLDLAKTTGAQVTCVTVSEPLWSAMPTEVAIAFPYNDYERAVAACAAGVLSAVAEEAAKRGVSCTVKHVQNQLPADCIVAIAKENGCDLIVMASHGRRGLLKLMLGSQAMKVVTMSTIPVLIYR